MRIINISAIKSIDDDGFTLVELLVTIMVSVVLIGSLSIVTNNNSHLAQRGRDLTSVNSFAENKIEELRSKGYLTITNGTTDITSQMPAELKSPRSGLRNDSERVGPRSPRRSDSG